MHHKVFPAELDYLHEMLAFIREHVLAHNISLLVLDQIILATEEVLVNIISYGYPNEKKGTIEMSCEDSNNPRGIKITIKDEGIPFNPIENLPSSLPSKSTVMDKTNDSLGGYGIYLFVELMDAVEYRRVNGCNVLSMTKYLS